MDVRPQHNAWVQLVDERSGKVYFHNTRTGRSQWHDPCPVDDSRLYNPTTVHRTNTAQMDRQPHEVSESCEWPSTYEPQTQPPVIESRAPVQESLTRGSTEGFFGMSRDTRVVEELRNPISSNHHEPERQSIQDMEPEGEQHVWNQNDDTQRETFKKHDNTQSETFKSGIYSNHYNDDVTIMRLNTGIPRDTIITQGDDGDSSVKSSPESCSEPIESGERVTADNLIETLPTFAVNTKLKPPSHSRSRSVVFNTDVQVQSYQVADEGNPTPGFRKIGHRRSHTSGSSLAFLKTTSLGVDGTTKRKLKHRRSLTSSSSFVLDPSFTAELETRGNTLAAMKDRRCWGRPDRARTYSEDLGFVESDDPDSATRFRTTSSVDPVVIARLYGMTDPLNSVSKKRFDQHDSTLPKVDEQQTDSSEHTEYRTLHGKQVRRARSNTTSTMFVTSTMSSPDGDSQMWCVSAAIYAHIVQALLNRSKQTAAQKKRYDIFNDIEPDKLPQDSDELDTPKAIPQTEQIYNFITRVHTKAQMEHECVIMTLIYLERLLSATKGRLHIDGRNWQSIILSCMILSSKVWDDLSMWNADFSLICPTFTLKRINSLEIALLEAMKYNVRVSSSTYAKYYFQLRSMRSKLGLAVGEDEARPLDMPGAARLEAVSDQYSRTIDVTSDTKENSGSINRRRSNTLFGGATREWMQNLHDKGYRFTPESSASTASIEQVVSMEAPPVMKDPW